MTPPHARLPFPALASPRRAALRRVAAAVAARDVAASTLRRATPWARSRPGQGHPAALTWPGGAADPWGPPVSAWAGPAGCV